MDIGTIIDIVLACIFCVSLVSGWHQGLVMKVASLIVVGVSYILAGILSKTISPYVADEISKNISKDTGILKNGVTNVTEAFLYTVIFMIVFFVVRYIFRKLIKVLKIVDHIPVIGFLNKAGGAVAGFLVDFIIIYVICSFLFTIVPAAAWTEIGLTGAVIKNTILLSVFAP